MRIGHPSKLTLSPRAAAGLTLVAAILVAATLVAFFTRSSASPASLIASNPSLEAGTRLSGPAPDFTLTDQFGRPVSLGSFRGKVVILAFNDSQCTTICPLTTSAMVDAKAMLGSAGSQVQLLGIDANPEAISVQDVRSYSQLHGMLHEWRFLTSSLPHLKSVWAAYHVAVAIQQGQIDHTPAVFVIDPQGRLAKLYLTRLSYAAVRQLGQILAEEASSLLPQHPQPDSHLSYARIPGISPRQRVSVPRAGGGSLQLGPDGGPRLSLFFDTWDQQVTNLTTQLEALNQYQGEVAGQRLAPLTAIDEASVEPGPHALPAFLAPLPHPLSYPVAIDPTGRLADGYEVQGEPWLVLTSGTGQILWHYDVSVSGWPSPATLEQDVGEALTRPPAIPGGGLSGSPPALAALHRQANQLLGSGTALARRVHALRGYPVVINVWASWCVPCRSEFGLFASASARYGRQVAFLGANTDDTAGDARSFLRQHQVSYPSYQTSAADLSAVLPQGLEGLPTTIFINSSGKVVHVQPGQYQSQGALDAAIATYALPK